MSSSRKEIGRVKLPTKFAEFGLKIDPTKMKPDAWMNRKKSPGKKPRTPTLTESKHSEIDDISAAEEIMTDVGKTYKKVSIPKNTRRKRSSKSRKQFIRMTEEDETSNDTEETIDDACSNSNYDTNSNSNSNSINNNNIKLIEQLKHEKLILEEWKNEIGSNAIEKCKTIEMELEISENNIQQLQLQIEGLQTQNHAQKQQVQAYQDEIEKFDGEKNKLQGQINHFEQLLNEQYMINKRLERKEEEFRNLKIEFESNKLSLTDSFSELKTLRKENNLLATENGKYLKLFDKLKENELKLKTEQTNLEYQILELTKKNEEIYDKLKRETVENRKQLQVANDFANDLSDQLQEIQNFASSPRPKPITNESPSSVNSITGDGIGYGKPLFEKRKTLKIKYENSSKLPNMSDIIMVNNTEQTMSDISDVDDEYINNYHKNKKKQFSVKINNNNQLPAIAQLNENDSHSNEFELIDSDNISIHDDDMDDMKINNNSNKKKKIISNHVPQLTDEINDAITDPMSEGHSGAVVAAAESYYINAKYVTANEQDCIDKLIRKIAGSSYYKFRNGTNMPMINGITRNKLKVSVIEYLDIIKSELINKGIEKDTIIIQYKRLSEEWEVKYKTLKREIKKRRDKSKQIKQKIDEPVVGGCKFWGWGLNPKWFVDLTGTQKEGSNAPKHALRFYVADDSDDTENNSII